MPGNARDLHLSWRRDLERVDRASAANMLRQVLADGGARRLRAILAEGLCGAAVDRMDDQAVVDQLAARIEAGQVVLFLRRSTGGAWVDRETPEPEPAQEAVLRAPAETTWIEVSLVDMECRPVPNERYRITTPEGTIREGKLNNRGIARVDDINEPGACKIEFPDLDADAWRDQVICPAPPSETIPFVEFELVDMAGRPVAGERYRVTFSDGTSQEGNLGDDGLIRYEGMPEGDCVITFPDLDGEAWEALEEDA